MTPIARTAFALLTCLLIAGCGADGEPVQPTANLGVGVSSSGVHAGASVGMRRGPWNISWGQYL